MSQYRSWLIVLLLAVQGCAMRSPAPCQTSDWYAMGYQDAVTGRVAGPHSCADGVTDAALDEYGLGRQAGLLEYCQAENGLRLGNEGQEYQGVCDGATEAEFLRAYRQGKAMHDVKAQIQRLGAILGVTQSERDSIGRRIRQKQTELGQSRADLETDAVLRAELRELEETKAMVEDEIEAIQAALHEQQAQLMQLRETSRRR